MQQIALPAHIDVVRLALHIGVFRLTWYIEGEGAPQVLGLDTTDTVTTADIVQLSDGMPTQAASSSVGAFIVDAVYEGFVVLARFNPDIGADMVLAFECPLAVCTNHQPIRRAIARCVKSLKVTELFILQNYTLLLRF